MKDITNCDVIDEELARGMPIKQLIDGAVSDIVWRAMERADKTIPNKTQAMNRKDQLMGILLER